MIIKNINIMIRIQTFDSKIGEIMRMSVDPDNITKTSSLMTIHSLSHHNTVIFTIKNIKKVKTASATIQDLLSAFQVAEESIISSGMI